MSFLTVLFLSFSLLFKSDGVIEQYQAPHTIQDLGLDNKVAIQRGKSILEDYQSRNSPCWSKAIKELLSKCSETTDIERSILAIKFANCHFEKSGQKTYDCTDEDTFQECTKAMKEDDTSSFIIYTEFFTHVTDICFYLQSDLWRQKTAETISKLSKATDNTIYKLEQSLHNQGLVLQSQKKTLWNQRLIMEREESLKSTLDASTKSATAAFDEMKLKAAQQGALFSQTFDNIFEGLRQITTLQTMFLGEFMGLQSFAFYMVSIMTCYLFTSCPRTMEARFLLFVLFALLVIVEKIIADKALEYKELHGSTAEWIHDYVWLARKVFVAVSAFILGYYALTYQDHIKMNTEMLEDIQKKMALIYDMEVMKRANMEVDGNQKFLRDKKQKDIAPVGTFYTPLPYTPSPLIPDNLSASMPFFSDVSDEEAAEKKSKQAKKFSKKNFITQTKNKDVDEDHIKSENTSNYARKSSYNLRRHNHSRHKSPNDNEAPTCNTPETRRKVTKKSKKEKKFAENTGLFSSDDDF